MTMDPGSQSRFVSRKSHPGSFHDRAGLLIVKIGALICLAVGLLVGAEMRAMTAVCLVMAGASLLIQGRRSDAYGWVDRLSISLAAATAMIGVARPGGMSMLTSCALTLSGIALMLNGTRSRRAVRLGQRLALISNFLPGLVLVGYLYRTDYFSGAHPVARMGFQAAFALFSLNFGIVFCRPQTRAALALLRVSPGGYVIRRLVVAILVLIPLLSAMGLWGEERGFYDARAGFAIQVFASILIFMPLFLRIGRQLDAAHELSEAHFQELKDMKFALDAFSIVAVTDGQGRITHVNDRFCEISKYRRDELIGKTHRIVSSGYHSREFYADLWKTISSGRVWRGEVLNRAKDGSVHWLDAVIVPFLDAAGRPYQYMALRSDITDRKRAEEALQESERGFRELADRLSEAARARDEFLSIASHELKTPLASLKLQVQLFEKRISRAESATLPNLLSKERILKLVDDIDKQATRLTRLVEEMLEPTVIRTGGLTLRKVKTDLSGIVRDVVERLRPALTEAGTPVEFITLEKIEGLWDPFRMEQVLTNLLVNAMRYGRKKPVTVRLEKRGESALLTVTDQGIGVRESDRLRIFDRFERAVSPGMATGLGLGLFITQQIVSAHGGRIWVKSEGLGHGSSFHVELPISSVEEHPLKTAAAG